MKKLLFALAVVSSLAGCASVPMASPEQDAAVKKFTPPPADKAGVYVYRNESLGGAVTMHVLLDNAPLGETAGHTYLYKEIAPGQHTITSQAENADSLTVEAIGGKAIYIWQEAKMGVLYARTKLHLVDDATGQKGVRESKLAETK